MSYYRYFAYELATVLKGGCIILLCREVATIRQLKSLKHLDVTPGLLSGKRTRHGD